MYRFAVIIIFINLFFLNCLFGVEPDSTQMPLSSSVSSKDPVRAMVYSAFIPGSGQVYADSYLHGAVFFSANGYFLYKIISGQLDANKYKDLWNQNPDMPEYEQKYLSANESRNMHIWLWAFSYMLNMMDTYVEASLYQFDQRIDLKVESDIIQSQQELLPALTLKVKF